MRALLITPGTSSEQLRRLPRKWDRVFDLGVAGPTTYESWERLLQCPIEPLPKLDDEDTRQIRKVLSNGASQLVDEHGLDWWDLSFFDYHEQLEQLRKLRRVAGKLNAGDEIFVTKQGFHAQALQVLMGRPVTCLLRGNALAQKLRHYARLTTKLSPSQLLQIAGDKYDSGYQFRRLFSIREQPCERPVVLLPSAYINVTRTALQYAETAPQTDFLLVTTRQSGWVTAPPANVKVAKLASYACAGSSRIEFESLLRQWNKLKDDLMHFEDSAILHRMGLLESFPKSLRNRLLIRDAWLQVLRREPVRAVLCADDANPSTRIPLLLAERQGLPAISCHHGALDGRHRYRPPQNSLFLAKGPMERDYLANACQSSQPVEVGAPQSREFSRRNSGKSTASVVFFSEPYEILGGRALEFYGEILPALSELALARGRELAIKLHPAESLRERRRLVKKVLSSQQYNNVRFIGGPLRDELLGNTWFAVTVLSTTAVECAVGGIPVFLCTWLDYSNYGYIAQFIKFGAGIAMQAPGDIARIPDMLEKFAPTPPTEFWEAMRPERLQEILSQPERARLAAAV